MRLALDGVTELLTREDLPKDPYDRGPRTTDLPLSSNPLWLMLALFLRGGKHDCNTDEGRS